LSNAAKTVERELGKKSTMTEEMKTIFDDKEITAVWVATREHWHVPASVVACQLGKDVYVEKNLSVNIWESHALRNRIFFV
jgi:predicted dehydrogenase